MKKLVPHTSRLQKAFCLLGATLSFFVVSPAQAVDLSDDFDGDSLDTVLWESTGTKTVIVDPGQLTWNNDGGNWATGDISSVQSFFLPPAGETTVIEWTLGPGEITAEGSNASPSGGDSTSYSDTDATGAVRLYRVRKEE